MHANPACSVQRRRCSLRARERQAASVMPAGQKCVRTRSVLRLPLSEWPRDGVRSLCRPLRRRMYSGCKQQTSSSDRCAESAISRPHCSYVAHPSALTRELGRSREDLFAVSAVSSEGTLMNPKNPDDATPTVADEASAIVDDEQVISKTLPCTPIPVGAAPLKAHVDRALGVTREFVIEQPVRAVLIAAAAGAALSALASVWLRDDLDR